MPFSLGDTAKAAGEYLDTAVKFTVKNPFATSLVIALLVCIIIFVIFRDVKNISKPAIRLLKSFSWTFAVTLIILFLQNSYLIKTISNDRAREIFQGGQLTGSEDAIKILEHSDGYVSLPPPMQPVSLQPINIH